VTRSFASAGLDGQVQFVGAIETSQVALLLSRSSIFCLPSHWEGFPLSLLEAMASEAAPIATDVGDVALILDGGRAGLVVPPRDTVALADAINRLISDATLRGRLGRAARRRVEQLYSVDRLAEAVHRLYEQVGGHSM
jgi:glycosyltransferase involved in cell wall biosynthesis